MSESKFDVRIHVTRKALAKMYGTTTRKVSACLEGRGVVPVGVYYEGKIEFEYYLMDAAIKAMEKASAPVVEEVLQVVPSREPFSFRPLKPSPHPRQADIDAAQPPVATVSMGGIGNGIERVFGYGRGR